MSHFPGPVVGSGHGDVMQRRFIFPLLVVTAVVVSGTLVSSPAMAFAAPDAEALTLAPSDTPAWNRPGFDWSQIENSTVVFIDGGATLVSGDLNSIWTSLIHMEVRNLTAGTSYKLLGPAGFRIQPPPQRASPEGEAVFWNIEPREGAWTIVENETGAVVTTIVMTYTPELYQASATGWGYYTPCYCHDYGSYRPPKGTSYRVGGWTLNKAVWSYTKHASVEMYGCQEFSIRVEAKASGGYAGWSGTAGGARTYWIGGCDGLSSKGSPTLWWRKDIFHEDRYSDGSMKWYLVGATQDFFVQTPAVNMRPSDPATAYIGAGKPDVTKDVTSKKAGTISIGGGAQVQGSKNVGLEIKLTGEGTESNRVKITMTSDPSMGRTFKWKFLTGDQTTTGLMGFVWREDEEYPNEPSLP